MPTFQTPQPITVAIDVPCGDVTVVAADRTDTVVEVRPADTSSKADVRAAEQIQVEFAGGKLSVEAPKKWKTFTPFGGNPVVSVTVEVPIGSVLDATVAMGRLVSIGEFDQSDLEVSAGDIVVERPGGSVTAKTAKGNIRVDEASRGVLRLETSMGDLEVGIRPGSAARLEVNALYGSVQNRMEPVDQSQGSGDAVQVFARNLYGNVTVGHGALV
ncbi:GIN domain-containing protein [Nocardia sp. NPDC058518]|uniref:GIN domain-containing protein n=1 Tax=Nocardia sp. NPDC058518 TaxID=3346534 RepID=UPI00365737EB